MGERLFDAGRTALATRACLDASRAQAARMASGAVALRSAQADLIAARTGRAASERRLSDALDRRAASKAKLAAARAL